MSRYGFKFPCIRTARESYNGRTRKHLGLESSFHITTTVPPLGIGAHRRDSTSKVSLALIAVFLLAVYAVLELSTYAGSDKVIWATLPEDQSEVRRWPGAMDLLEDYHIAEDKMDGLIADGLYDPWNDYPLEIGEPAPDFELMPLRFYDFAIDRGVTKSNAGSLFDPVRLSSFRGNLPVALIFGSYT